MKMSGWIVTTPEGYTPIQVANAKSVFDSKCSYEFHGKTDDSDGVSLWVELLRREIPDEFRHRLKVTVTFLIDESDPLGQCPRIDAFYKGMS